MRVILKPYYSVPTHGADLTNARLRIVVEEAEDITKNIFVHERYTIMKTSGLVQENRFVAVAKPGDLTIYPVGSPAAVSSTPPYFRLDCVDLVFNSPEILEETMSDIVAEVTKLVRSMEVLDQLEEQAAIVITA